MKIAISMPDIRHMLSHNWDVAIEPIGNLLTVTVWIKLAALSLLISTAITAIVATTGFALWWWLMR